MKLIHYARRQGKGKVRLTWTRGPKLQNTLKDWVMAKVRFSQQQHGWWQALSSCACTRPGGTVAGTCAPPPSPGQPVRLWWQGKTGRACQSAVSVEAVSVDESCGTDSPSSFLSLPLPSLPLSLAFPLPLSQSSLSCEYNEYMISDNHNKTRDQTSCYKRNRMETRVLREFKSEICTRSWFSE